MGIYDTLNLQQKKAVLQTDGPVLILAGAGSGKTRVLTHRVAYLIDECNTNPWNIMAITFTNKAAGEMRERVDKIVGFGAESIWVSTFHSSCVRILRRYADRLGYSNNFTIYDTDDSKTVMKDICKKFQLETTTLKLRIRSTACIPICAPATVCNPFRTNGSIPTVRIQVSPHGYGRQQRRWPSSPWPSYSTTLCSVSVSAR